MQTLWKSKRGDVETKEYWVTWYYKSFNIARSGAMRKGDFPTPVNGWEKVEKLLGLEAV